MNSYIGRFNAEMPNIKKSSDIVYLSFLLAGLNKTKKFWKEIAKEQPKMMPQLYKLADNYKRYESSIIMI